MIFTPEMLQNNQLWFNCLKIYYQREEKLKMEGKLQNNIQSTLVDPSDPDSYSVICCMINFIFDWIILLLSLLFTKVVHGESAYCDFVIYVAL